MAEIVGAIATSHIPAIGKAIAGGLQNDPYWKPFFDGFVPVHDWLARNRPDLAVVFYNDHGLNFFLDRMPTFAVGAAALYSHADEGWGIPITQPFRGDPALSWHVIEELVGHEFDVVTCQEMLVDHAVAVPMQLMYPGAKDWPISILPVSINTVQHPLPSAERCYKLGAAIGNAIGSYDRDMRIVVLGTGGLSHQLDGKRAGHINREFDQFCMDRIADAPEALTAISNHDLVDKAGTQGVELLNWIAMRGAMTGGMHEIHRAYHIPVSNTAAATMIFEPGHAAAARAA
jgi:protocatechuate 4,5-dioxygenase beta chain